MRIPLRTFTTGGTAPTSGGATVTGISPAAGPSSGLPKSDNHRHKGATGAIVSLVSPLRLD
jgi:hypothetical protein